MGSLGNTLSERLLQESSGKGESIFHRGISQNREALLAIITSLLWDLTKARKVEIELSWGSKRRKRLSWESKLGEHCHSVL